jgi:hypothetical protein
MTIEEDNQTAETTTDSPHGKNQALAAESATTREEINQHTEPTDRQDVNLTKEFMRANADKTPYHWYVSEHGQAVPSETERISVSGYEIRVSKGLSEDEKALIRDAFDLIWPRQKECFANALKLYQYDSRFKYAEGFAAFPEAELVGEHAWCLLDGDPAKLVDFTADFEDHYGVPITSDDILHQYIGVNLSNNGIIGNRSNDYRFLREQGYAVRGEPAGSSDL